MTVLTVMCLYYTAIPNMPSSKLSVHQNLPITHANEFIISWEYTDNTQRGIDYYSISVTGDFCGNCSNISRNVSIDVNELSCWEWEANGQTCNVTVTAVEPVCGFAGSSFSSESE